MAATAATVAMSANRRGNARQLGDQPDVGRSDDAPRMIWILPELPAW
jgi:hypothetical protein